MQVEFSNNELEELYRLPIEQIGKAQFPKGVIKGYRKRIDILRNADDLSTIAKLKGMNLEKLNDKKYKGLYSVKINDQFRLIIDFVNETKLRLIILELSKHYE